MFAWATRTSATAVTAATALLVFALGELRRWQLAAQQVGFDGSSMSQPSSTTAVLDLSKIDVEGGVNPGAHFDEASLAELEASIRQDGRCWRSYPSRATATRSSPASVA
jgi:hypothetical protein